ncbi:hypothetical protein N657DRAFT_671458 [Parathielavia appendiculata]|uniref:Nephrocystin 3-like N-terminal domain-containing protein n=1 Tax=Parathielavia appendiculata TaxID=2587402 RepID=A0AAN6U1L0_9PEZI|nr:hypothetical protein N657DRAFT_671458 [Parathielavia appendiculata]
MSPSTVTSNPNLKLPVTFLITGCSSGFGLTLSRLVLSHGHTVIATSRNPSRTPDLVSEITSLGGRWLQLDVDDKTSPSLIYVLVNNAGYSIHAPVEVLTEGELRQMMETLYFGPARLIRAVLPYMRERRSGVVVNMSSGAGLEGNESMGEYAAAKAALDGLSKVLAKEVAPFGVRVLTVQLGTFNTHMTSSNALDSPDSYAAAWIAALPIERAAAEARLDEEHAAPIAATMAFQLLASLPSIRVGLLVDIGGGITRPDEARDIRLGDIAVSQPDGTTGGVCQYDLVKAKSDDKRERKDFLGRPPTVLLNALASIQADHERKDSKVPFYLQQMSEKNPKMGKRSKQNFGYTHQSLDNDRLFKASCHHIPGPDCRGYDISDEVQRDPRDAADPKIHHGIIASGNTVAKDAATRDRTVGDVSEDYICFDMEAAGLMNHFPCIVIRGTCDYADSHKNDRWQRYASATAAAYAKELLAYVPVAEVQKTKRALEVLQLGCDKTVLNVTVLVHLAKGNDRLILSFLFDFSYTTKQTLDGMLRSLAFQLYQGGTGTAALLGASFQTHQDDRDQPATKMLEDVVLAVQKECSVIIDALDESTTRGELLLWMNDVVSGPELSHARLICTSRPEPEFMRDIPSLIGEENCLALDEESINAEIRSYVAAQLLQRHINGSNKEIRRDFPMAKYAAEVWRTMLRWLRLRKIRPERQSVFLKVEATFQRKGADVNAQGSDHGNALQAASLGGHQEIVQLLFNRGVSVNAKGGDHGNALQAASWAGRQEVVQLLLDKGADDNAKGDDHGSALQAASWGGHQEVVQLLLDKGADANAKGGVL